MFRLDAMSVIQNTDLLEQASRWMRDRNWHQMLGKHGAFTQSLYHHTSVQLNLLLALRSLLCGEGGMALSENQFLAVFVASLCHDVGKENPEWQRALRCNSPLPHHVVEPLARAVSAEWAQRLGRTDEPSFLPSVLAAIGLHHKATQGVASTLDQLLHGGQRDPRWRELADLVEAADKICSCSDVEQAAEAADKWLGLTSVQPRFSVTFHRVQVLRGVSTVFVHKACQDAHIAAGWTPALHFSDGTLYLSSAAAQVNPPTHHDVRSELAQLFDQVLSATDLPQQVVGNLHGGDPVPKPELFEPGRFIDYLKVAASRSKPANFRKKHRKSDGELSREMSKSLAKYRGLRTAASSDDIEAFERFVMAVPLDSMFRFFQAVILGDKVILEDNWPIDTAALASIESGVAKTGGGEDRKAAGRERRKAAARRSGRELWLKKVSSAYEAEFGPGSFDGLKSITNDAAINLAKAVDYFLDQELQVNGGARVKWSSRSAQQQESEARNRLAKVFAVAMVELPKGILSAVNGGGHLADVFVRDAQIRIHAEPTDVERQFSSYLSAKVETQDLALCPFSNESTQGVLGTGSDLGVSTDGHSNRLPMQGNTWKNWRKGRTGGGVPMAVGSRFELMLRRLLLGRPTEQLIVLFPPAQLGPLEGHRLTDNVSRLEADIELYSGALSPDPSRRFSFALTDQISRRWFADRSAPPAQLLTYSSAQQTATEHRRNLGKSLMEAFGPSNEDNDGTTTDTSQELLASLNEECGTSFGSWLEAVDQLYLGQSPAAKAALNNSEELRIRRKEALKLRSPGRFICQTPSMIIMLLPNAISLSDENEANAAIRQLFLSLVLNAALEVCVGIIAPEEALTFPGCDGSVLLPRNPALRAEVARVRRAQAAAGNPCGVTATHGWLLPGETLPWLNALAAVHELSREFPKRSNGKARMVSIFPRRSALYDILSARSAGFVLRRIEDKLGRQLRSEEVQHLEPLQAFLG
jgi:hypothetical protein